MKLTHFNRITCRISLVTLACVSLTIGLDGCKKAAVHSGEETQNGQAMNGAASGSSNSGNPANGGAIDSNGGTAGAVAPTAKNGNGQNAIPGGTVVGQWNSNTQKTPEGQNPTTNNGSNGNAGSNNQTANGAPIEPAKPKEIPITCFTESFKHKKTPGHDSAEACSHHKNIFKLSHADLNTKSVCVRVNDVPVKFERQGKSAEFLIGSIAGPDATITVSYCIGKNTCEEQKKNDCVIPKDEFLDAIGGNSDEGAAVAQWENTENAGDAKLNNDVKRELADLDEQTGDAKASQVFKDWISQKAAPACVKKQPS